MNDIQQSIQDRQLKKPLTTAGLRHLVRQGRWSDIGQMFNFEPAYTQISEKLYFNWTCCTPEFWAAYQPHKYARGKVAPEKQMFRSARLAAKAHPTARMKSFQGQKGICHYCKQETEWKNWTVDHKTPRCRGGKNTASNKVGACKTCNHSKANLTEAEFLHTEPRQRKKLIELNFQILRGQLPDSFPPGDCLQGL